jgi:preprotein translocase subunit SecF
MDIIKPGRVIDFMGMRRFWIFLSTALVLASAILLWKPGPKYGIDFLGGTEVTIRFDRAVDAARLRRALTAMGHGNAEVVPSANMPNTYIIRVEKTSSITPERERQLRQAVRDRLGTTMQLQEFRVSPGGDHIVLQLSGTKTDLEVAQLVRDAGVNVRGDRALRVGEVEEHRWQVPLVSIGDEIFAGLTRELGTEGTLQASVWVSPKAGKELRDQAIRAVLYSLVFIMIYVAFRFDLRFAPGGILGLFHDAIVTLGFFVLTRKEVTISTVAAILTVVGYSMNDTIIVYDRIRENLARRRGLRMLDVINVSVSEMFSRTIITSTTVILSVLPFTIWGSGVIQNFAWAMIVGVLAGTYSSIYVAAPLTEWIDSRFFHQPAAKAGTPPPSGGAHKDAGAPA